MACRIAQRNNNNNHSVHLGWCSIREEQKLERLSWASSMITLLIHRKEPHHDVFKNAHSYLRLKTADCSQEDCISSGLESLWCCRWFPYHTGLRTSVHSSLVKGIHHKGIRQIRRVKCELRLLFKLIKVEAPAWDAPAWGWVDSWNSGYFFQLIWVSTCLECYHVETRCMKATSQSQRNQRSRNSELTHSSVLMLAQMQYIFHIRNTTWLKIIPYNFQANISTIAKLSKTKFPQKGLPKQQHWQIKSVSWE